MEKILKSQKAKMELVIEKNESLQIQKNAFVLFRATSYGEKQPKT